MASSGVDDLTWWHRLRGFWRRFLGPMAIPIFGASGDWADEDGESRSDAQRIRRRQRRIGEMIEGLRRWRTMCAGFALLAPIGVVILIYLTRPTHDSLDKHVSLIVLVAVLEVFALVSFFLTRARLQETKTELRLIEYDAMLVELDARKQIAANLFFKHQAELKQYYDQTLRQSRQVVRLGIGCVLVGLTIVAGAGILVFLKPASESQQYVTAALGVTSAILSGFVARVYLRMYRGSNDALGVFHSRMVETNRIHFANLFASGIADDERFIEAMILLVTATVTAE